MRCDPGDGCWCAELPHLLPVPEVATKGCLCRNCLIKQMEQREAARPNDGGMLRLSSEVAEISVTQTCLDQP